VTSHPHILLANGSLQGGGAEHVLAILARRLRAAGYRITVGVMKRGGEVEEALRAEGFDVLAGIGSDARLSVFSTAKRLRRIIADRQVQIVHTHDLQSLADIGTSWMRTRTFRHIHTFHFGNYPHVPAKDLWLERIFARRPDQLVAVGHAQREALIAALRLPPGRITTIWNGVDLPEPIPSATPATALEATPAGSAQPVPVIGSVSTFFRQKGLPTLLEAASLMRNNGVRFRLVMVGEGSMRAELEADVAKRALGDVVSFAGWRPDARTELLPTFDVFVQSSYWEAMSLVILEAMAAGRPIVATSVGENPRVLKDGQSGLLVPPRDAGALASAMTRLLQDRGLRCTLGRAARAAYVSEFTGEAMAERYMQAYHRLWPADGLSAP
jgi:glycosyltransferase involved in cell wall biosynthesis